MINENEHTLPPIKCIFIGLDNSGKTSILTILEERFAQIGNMQPTKKVKRKNFNILGLPIVAWDMGGQKVYQKEYLLKKKYFEGVNLLFYVIDIQDPDRFMESFDYFLNILQILVMLQMKPYILVFFHKSDPDIVDESHIFNRAKNLEKQFLDLPKVMNITFNKTSIYDYEHLSSIFVQGILKILPKGQIIQDVLNDFMEKTESNAIMLLDENVLTIAEVYNDEASRMTCKICGPHFATIFEKLHKYDLSTPDIIEMQIQGWIFFKYIIYENTRFYLVFFTKIHDNFNKINKMLPIFTKDLFNIIRFVL